MLAAARPKPSSNASQRLWVTWAGSEASVPAHSQTAAMAITRGG